jgi:hypothetical protein
MANDVFDERYYRRYYRNARTRVHGKKEIARLCTAISSLLDWWGHPIANVIDVGAGVGLWRDWFRENRPRTRYRSTEVSSYACEKFGHEQRDITRWHADETFDLVVCQGVLPYIDDAGCARAIDNLATMTRGFLYLEAVTKRDLSEVVERARTDVEVHERTGDWYRKRLSRRFVQVGAGLWAKKGARVLFYELERP